MKKKFYGFLALMISFSFVSVAQNIDFEAFTTVVPGTGLCPGYHFSPSDNPTGDSVTGRFGIIVGNGPDPVVEGDVVRFYTSFNSYLTEAECIAQGVPFSDTARYFWTSGRPLTAADVTAGGFAYSYDAIDSIGLMMDWEQWSTNDSVVIVGPPFENFVEGKSYGIFVRVWGIGASASDIDNTDPDAVNNRAVVEVKWHECATSIADLIVNKSREALKVYPNPVSNEVSFEYNFTKNANVKVLVRDITGRILKTANYDRVNPGTKTFKVDVAELNKGMYTIEMSTGELSAISKFTKN